MNEKARFDVALSIHLYTYSLYSDVFIMIKNDS